MQLIAWDRINGRHDFGIVRFGIRLRIAHAVVAAMILAWPSGASADAIIAEQYVSDAKLVGKGRLRYLGFNVYDAELYASSGGWKSDSPYVLTLHYLRNFTGEAIAKRSVEEMRKQGYRNEARLSDWYRQMAGIFPDVSKRTPLTGVRDRNGHTIFYRNQRRIGAIRDREFTRRFFDIWLGGATSAPALRKQLIGAAF